MKLSRKSKGRRRVSRKKHFIYSNASIFIFLIASIFLGYQLVGLVGKRDLSEEKLSAAVHRLEEYQKEEKELREYIANLETDEGKERAIRERFNVAKEGEGVIYVIEDDNSLERLSVSAVGEKKEDKKSIFVKILSLFSF